ncbi:MULTISPECIES: hypothetical protein [Luteimonas]|uniref:hypothetical protein n=1 Tax=Luteimonas TaxID=83614 RepID=UPI0018EC5647|nr:MULTISPECIES: hypothetical protein [Luteimonas]
MLWTTPLPGVEKVPTVLEVDGVGVARMMQRVDGSWFVLLDYHYGFDRQRRRDCSSYETGVQGTETWARRHIVRLLQESAERRAQLALARSALRQP